VGTRYARSGGVFHDYPAVPGLGQTITPSDRFVDPPHSRPWRGMDFVEAAAGSWPTAPWTKRDVWPLRQGSWWRG